MPANLENSAVATGLEKVHFHPIPKKGNPKECSNHRTIALITHTSKVMLKILKARLQQFVNHDVPGVQAEKAEEPDIKLTKSIGSSKKQENTRNICFCLLTMPKPLTVWITTNWKILKEIEIPDHLTCLLRNLYAGQEAIIRTRHETTDRFQIGKEVHQGCIPSP